MEPIKCEESDHAFERHPRNGDRCKCGERMYLFIGTSNMKKIWSEAIDLDQMTIQ